MSSQVQNSSKLNDDTDEDMKGNNSNNKMSSGSWHQNNSMTGGQKLGMSNYSSNSGSLSNSDILNDSNDANKANYSAMTKKRKAMHQANSSNNRNNSADDNVNKYDSYVSYFFIIDFSFVYLFIYSILNWFQSEYHCIDNNLLIILISGYFALLDSFTGTYVRIWV